MNWKSFGQPQTIAKGSNNATLIYDADNQRARQTMVTSAGTITTDYVNSAGGTTLVFESELKGGIRENRHFLSAGGNVFAVYKTFSGTGAPAAQLRYLVGHAKSRRPAY